MRDIRSAAVVATLNDSWIASTTKGEHRCTTDISHSSPPVQASFRRILRFSTTIYCRSYPSAAVVATLNDSWIASTTKGEQEPVIFCSSKGRWVPTANRRVTATH
jgi:hypothetical protein